MAALPDPIKVHLSYVALVGALVDHLNALDDLLDALIGVTLMEATDDPSPSWRSRPPNSKHHAQGLAGSLHF